MTMKLLSAMAFAGLAASAPVPTTLVFGGAGLALSTMPTFAEACQGQDALTSRCEVAADQSYQGGGHKPKTVPIEACLDDRMVDSIRLDDGSFFWEAGFYYNKGKPEVVLTVKNKACWTHAKSGKRQTGVPGAWVVAFICCDYYCGWVGGKIGADGRVDLKPIALPEVHDPLRKHKLADGQYDRKTLLN